MAPKLNRWRAQFVLTQIDQILAWEQRKEAERDTRFVELGRYLCEVRAGQYWRVENLKSFDEFLERRFPESRRKAASRSQSARPVGVPLPYVLQNGVHLRYKASAFDGRRDTPPEALPPTRDRNQ